MGHTVSKLLGGQTARGKVLPASLATQRNLPPVKILRMVSEARKLPLQNSEDVTKLFCPIKPGFGISFPAIVYQEKSSPFAYEPFLSLDSL